MDSLERIHHNFVCVALQPDAMNVTLASVKLRGETHGFQWVEKLPPTVWDLETWDFWEAKLIIPSIPRERPVPVFRFLWENVFDWKVGISIRWDDVGGIRPLWQ